MYVEYDTLCKLYSISNDQMKPNRTKQSDSSVYVEGAMLNGI